MVFHQEAQTPEEIAEEKLLVLRELGVVITDEVYDRVHSLASNEVALDRYARTLIMTRP